jgi:sterol desaturase/sphingolipid hydroxylase (fatty acid hydroxylase superfamily)
VEEFPVDDSNFQRGSARMFRSDFLEWFSHVHPVTPAVLYIPVIVISLAVAVVRYDATPLDLLWQVPAGYLVWTLLEYFLHRFFFHLPVRGPISERAYFFLHGVHHDWPWDRSRLVMPPAVSISLAVIFYFLFRGLFGAAHSHPVFAGLVLGYLIYDTIHWYTHACAPRNRIGKYLRKQHMIHHFKAPGTRFGVSCPWWDFVFRTTGR